MLIIMRKLLITALIAFASVSLSAQELSGTYMVAQRDTCDLYMDVYLPAPGSQTTIDGKAKPTILFVFGGGFITGSRNDRLVSFREADELLAASVRFCHAKLILCVVLNDGRTELILYCHLHLSVRA